MQISGPSKTQEFWPHVASFFARWPSTPVEKKLSLDTGLLPQPFLPGPTPPITSPPEYEGWQVIVCWITSCGCADNSLQQCWTHSETFLVNSGSVYGPNIRAERAMCLEKMRKHYYDLLLLPWLLFYYCFCCYFGKKWNIQLWISVKLCLYRSKDKRKHKLSYQQTWPPVLFAWWSSQAFVWSSLKMARLSGPGSGGVRLWPWVGYV